MPEWRSTSALPDWNGLDVRVLGLHDATDNEGHWLSQREPAWKLRAVVHRNVAAQFSPDEKASVVGAIVPATNEFNESTLSKRVGDATVLIRGFGGPGVLILSNGMILRGLAVTNGGLSSAAMHRRFERFGSNGEGERFTSDKPFFLVEVSGLDEHDEIRLRLVDDSNRSISLEGAMNFPGFQGPPEYEHRFRPSPQRLYFRRFQLPPNARSVSLDVAVSRALPFEFIFDPREMLIPAPSTNTFRRSPPPFE